MSGSCVAPAVTAGRVSEDGTATERQDEAIAVGVMIRAARLRAAMAQMPLVLAVTIVIAGITAGMLWWVQGDSNAWWWFGAVLALSVIRLVAWRLLRNDPGLRGAWLVTTGGAALSGLLWGASAALANPWADSSLLFFGFVVGGMCAGGVSAYAAHFPSAVAFILPTAVPLAMRFATQGTPLAVSAAVMVLLFVVALLRIAWGSHRIFGALFRMQAELGRRTAALEAAEVQLRGEVTAHRATEAALRHVQKMEAIGQLTGGMAHDFNNMLTAIGGSLQLIEIAAGSDATILRHVESAERAADRGARLVASLLGFARRDSTTATPVEINALMGDFLPLLNRAVAPCVLQTRFAPHLPCCVVDPALLQSAVLNLVLNARDASARGGIVKLETALTEAGAEAESARLFVTVSVTDQGSGMTDDVQARAFDPFFTTKELGKGSGLGLSQVQSFARQAGGEVTLRSRPGAGTVVTVALPASPVSQHPATAVGAARNPLRPAEGAG